LKLNFPLYFNILKNGCDPIAFLVLRAPSPTNKKLNTTPMLYMSFWFWEARVVVILRPNFEVQRMVESMLCVSFWLREGMVVESWDQILKFNDRWIYVVFCEFSVSRGYGGRVLRPNFKVQWLLNLCCVLWAFGFERVGW
jgi:hypothetical protein